MQLLVREDKLVDMQKVVMVVGAPIVVLVVMEDQVLERVEHPHRLHLLATLGYLDQLYQDLLMQPQ